MTQRTKQDISQDKVFGSNTFEEWRELTNNIVDILEDTVTVGTSSGSTTGDITVTGTLSLIGEDGAGNPTNFLKTDRIRASAESSPFVLIENSTEVSGEYLKLSSPSSDAADASIKLQFSNPANIGSEDTWFLSANADHSQLTIGDGTHNLMLHTNDTITSQNLIIDNLMLGPDISGVTIGANSQTTGNFTLVNGTTITASTGFVGDIQGNVTGNVTGDIFANNGTFKVLENGTDGSNATFRGDILAKVGGQTILNSGTDGSNATFSGNVTGSLFGNADTATLAGDANTLATPRNIGGVEFDGSQDIDLPGVNTSGNQNTSGIADYAKQVMVKDTEKQLSGNQYSVVLTDHDNSTDAYRTLEADLGMEFNASNNTLTVDHLILRSGGDIKIRGASHTSENPVFDGEMSGNAATATKLKTAVNIGGVSFDGSGPINLPGVNTGGNQNTSGKANTAGHADKAAALSTTGLKIGGVSFNATESINLPGVNVAGTQNTSGNAAKATHATKATKADKATAATSAGTAGTAGTAASAGHAGYWTTARTLSLKGDVTGSVSVQGKSAMNINCSVTDASHTHTLSNITGLDEELKGYVHIDNMWPPGSVICMANDNNPNDFLGAGTWTRFGQGKTLVGGNGAKSGGSDPYRKESHWPQASKFTGHKGGGDTMKLTTSNLPAHSHVHTVKVGRSYSKNGRQAKNGVVQGSNGEVLNNTTAKYEATTKSAGSGNSFSLLQSYVVVAYWIRS